ncbi:MipA/OmpV family protein [bacterium]|nr:MipA/OmpV family protein [bacterium]
MNKWLWLLIGFFLIVERVHAENDTEKVEETELTEITESHWGIGLATGWINDYPGAAQGRTRYIAVPTYKGKHITIDRQEGVKGDLVSQSRFKFSISFSFLFPTASVDIPVRTGMPDLDWTLQLGPELQIYLFRSRFHTMFIRLPFRFVASTDFSHRFESRDWNLAPSIRNAFQLGNGWGEIGTRLELDYASERFNDYFYQVEPQYATAQRPAYNARRGLMTTTVGINYSYYDLFPFIFFCGANLYFHGDSANSDSPLLVKNRNHSILGGMIWYF